MSDKIEFSTLYKDVTSPAIGAFPIVPSDSEDLPEPIRSVTINGSGKLTYVSSIDGLEKTTNDLPAGSYPLFAIQIKATGTTATSLTGWV